MNRITPLPEWKNLLDRFKDRDYNSTIHYDELNSVLSSGDIREDKRHIFEQFKKYMLREHCKALENIQNVGYRVVNPNEHVRLTNKEMKRAERRARVAVDIILHTDMDRLTERERAIATMAATRIQPLLATMIGEQKSLKEEQKFNLPFIPRK